MEEEKKISVWSSSERIPKWILVAYEETEGLDEESTGHIERINIYNSGDVSHRQMEEWKINNGVHVKEVGSWRLLEILRQEVDIEEDR